MKPKISTGFLTPPVARKKKENAPTPDRNPNEIIFSDEIYETIMNDPIKRKLMLQIIAQEKDAILAYKKEEERKKLAASSPVNKLKGKYKCESPTALLRRRALEQKARENDNDSDRSASRQSTSSAGSPVPSPIPFDKLLDGVRAYVEVRSNDQDRSAGAKALMVSMGAKIRDVFTKDVTHVVFKDGSFSTYQKAKLMKVHLVSVLWLEAVRKNMFRVPEKEYPALGASTFDHDVSSVCSQIQKEYEDIIREEVRKSIASGTPLPSTETLREKRRMTIMSPVISSSFSQSSQDKEVDLINLRKTIMNQSISRPSIATLKDSPQSNRNRRRTDFNYQSLRPNSAVLDDISPEMTSDDDSEVGLINGEKSNRAEISIDNFVIDDTVLDDNSANLLSYARNKRPDMSDMELTNLQNNTGAVRKSLREINLPQDFTDMELTGIMGSVGKSAKKKLVTKENISTTTRRRKSLFPETNVTKTTSSSDKSTNISDESVLKRINASKISSANTSMSNLQISNDNIEILSKNCSSPLQASNINKNSSSSLTTTTTTTNMSSLRIGSTSKSATTTTRTDMSDLKMSSENDFKINSRSTDMSSLKISEAEDSNGLDSTANEVNSKFKPVRNTKSKKSDESSDMSSLCISSDKSELSSLRLKLFSTELSSLKLSEINSGSSDKSPSKIGAQPILLESSFNDSCGSSEINYGRNRRQSKLPLNDSTLSKTSSKLSFSPVDINPVLSIVDDNITTRKRNNTNNNSKTPKGTPDSYDHGAKRKSVRLAKPIKDTKLENNNVVNEDVLDDIKSTKKDTPKTRKSIINNKKINATTKNLKTPIEKATNENLIEENEDSNSDTFKTTKNPTPKSRKSIFNKSKENINLVDEASTKNETQKNIKPSKEKKRNENVSEPEKQTITESEDSSSDSPNKRQRRVRKLYEPTDCHKITIDQSDDLERQEKRLRALKRKSQEEIVVPEAILQNPQVFQNKEILKEPELEVLKSPNKKPKTNKEVTPKTSKAPAKKKTPKKPKKKIEVVLDTSADEQKDLLNELMNTKTPKRRPTIAGTQSERSTRRSQRITQAEQTHVFAVPITPARNRRSTLEFQSLTQSLKKVRIDTGKHPSIVCTKMHKNEVETFTSIVKKLGRFKTEDEVTKNTTHVVAGEPKRTINMLRAIALGCWVLRKEWLFASLEAGKWLSEEDYEETDFSPTVQQSRIQRQAFGSKFSMDVFREAGYIYIAKSTTPRWSDLKELIEICKGKVVLKPENAKVIIGEYRNQDGTTCVKEVWVLDSITFNKMMPLRKYLLSPRSSSPCV